jgi:hypothetical protein
MPNRVNGSLLSTVFSNHCILSMHYLSVANNFHNGAYGHGMWSSYFFIQYSILAWYMLCTWLTVAMCHYENYLQQKGRVAGRTDGFRPDRTRLDRSVSVLGPVRMPRPMHYGAFALRDGDRCLVARFGNHVSRFRSSVRFGCPDRCITEHLPSKFGDRCLVAHFGNHVSRLYEGTRVVYGTYFFLHDST